MNHIKFLCLIKQSNCVITEHREVQIMKKQHELYAKDSFSLHESKLKPRESQIYPKLRLLPLGGKHCYTDKPQLLFQQKYSWSELCGIEPVRFSSKSEHPEQQQ